MFHTGLTVFSNNFVLKSSTCQKVYVIKPCWMKNKLLLFLLVYNNGRIIFQQSVVHRFFFYFYCYVLHASGNCTFLHVQPEKFMLNEIPVMLNLCNSLIIHHLNSLFTVLRRSLNCCLVINWKFWRPTRYAIYNLLYM